MRIFIETLISTLTLAAWVPAAQTIIPLADRILNIIQQPPYCPSRPASPEWQRSAFYEFISEIFFEENGVNTSFDNFISPDYIQHSPFLLSGRNNTLSVLTANGGFTNGVNVTII
ncbi:hypothetical protein N431DRAFT_447870 [Stipitochalara longipes BDJ]|nr:hypothetical protein N431DRAFT_447870 [Stipitochalara longipes BDJ]